MNSEISSEPLWLAALSDEGFLRFTTLLAHGLTIGQRVLCFEGNLEGARQLNEANHQISGLLVDQVEGRMRRVFEPFLFNLTDAQARAQGAQAWAYAKSRLGA
ncbi:hypothetical protein D3C87_1053570 [compost metagenome]